MKTKIAKKMADAWHQITLEARVAYGMVRRTSFLFTLILALGCFYVPGTVVGQSSGDMPTDTSVGTATQANTQAQSLFHTSRTFSGYILLCALIASGLMAAFGNYKTAWGVGIAAVIMYGGTWILGLIGNTLTTSNGS